MPEISNDMLNNQLETLSAQRQKAVDDLHAIDGAIQLCTWLLSQLNEPETPTPDGAATNGDEKQ